MNSVTVNESPPPFLEGTNPISLRPTPIEFSPPPKVYRNALKALTRSESIPADIRFVLNLKMHSLPLNTSPLRVVNRCTLSKRPRGVYEYFRMNRTALKLKMMRGQIPGMGRATWQAYGRQLHKKWARN